jgi:hypothetical protein
MLTYADVCWRMLTYADVGVASAEDESVDRGQGKPAGQGERGGLEEADGLGPPHDLQRRGLRQSRCKPSEHVR